MILRDWQKDAYESFSNAGFNGVLKVGTGKGKTVFALYCISEFLKKNPGFRTAIVVPTVNLMHQWREAVLKFLRVDERDVTLFYGKEKDSSGRIVIYVVNSAVNGRGLGRSHLTVPFDFMIADECHRYGSALFSRIFENDFRCKLGLSATPERENDSEGTIRVFEGIGPKIYELNHLDDVDAVPPFVIWSIFVPLTRSEKESYEENSFEIVKLNKHFLDDFGISSGDGNFLKKIKKLAEGGDASALKLLSLWSKQAGIKYEAENKLAVIKELVEMEKGGKIIVFNERINFTEKVCLALSSDRELNVFQVHSGMKNDEIKSVLNDFKEAKECVLVVPKIVDEGYDVPDASVAIVASFTRSARQMIQRDGRILRKTSEKKKATRYSLIVEDLENEKYFEVLRKSGISDRALNGEWLRFNPENSSFSDSDFKKRFMNFGNASRHDRYQFEEWVSKRLDHYESSLKDRDVDKIEKRVDFFSRFLDVIEHLSRKNPQRWGKLKEKLSRKAANRVRFLHDVSEKDRIVLKRELRAVNSRLILENCVFDSIMRFIENEPFELEGVAKEYVENLADGAKPDVWPEKLYLVIQEMRRKIRDEDGI